MKPRDHRISRRGNSWPRWLLERASPPRTKFSFTDVTAQAGIKFVHNAGKAGKKYLPETLGSGAAFFDADGDGWPDILLDQQQGLDAARAPNHCRALSQQS